MGDFEQDMDISFSDILDNLDFGAMGLLEHQRGDWMFIFDIAYISLEIDKTASNTIASVSTNSEATQIVVEAFVGHRIFKSYYANNYLKSAFDIFAGVRYNYVDVKVDASVTVLGLNAQRALKSDIDFVDPVLMMRFKHNFNEKWGCTIHADAGGFGVGSELTWQAIAAVNYNLPGNFRIYGGLRYLHWDYDDDTRFGDMNWNADYAGPIIGITKRF